MKDIEKTVNTLINNNCKYSFGITGGGNSLSLIKELADQNIKYINATHEASAAIMAGAYTRSSENRLGISISIKGPGVANSYGGICFNHYENIPSLSISESYSNDISLTRMHKRLDHKAILKPITKAISSIGLNQSTLDEILSVRTDELPGPIHLNLCNGSEYFINEFINKNHQLTDDFYEHISNKLNKCKKPILIIGSSILRLYKDIDFNQLKIPVFSTVASRGLIDENNKYSAGPFTGEGKELSLEYILSRQSDLLICLGVSATELTGQFDPNLKCIFLEPERCLNYKITSQNPLIIPNDYIYELISNLKHFIWGESIIHKSKNILLESLSIPEWSPYKIYDVMNRTDINYIQVLDTGSFATVAEHSWTVCGTRRYFGASNSRFMGTAIPSSIGISLANSDIPVICIFGDGGFRAYPYEIQTARVLELPIIFIYMCDSSYSSIIQNSEDRFVKEALLLETKEACDIVEGMGINSFRCFDTRSFKAILESWDKTNPIFIQCIFTHKNDYQEMTFNIR